MLLLSMLLLCGNGGVLISHVAPDCACCCVMLFMLSLTHNVACILACTSHDAVACGATIAAN